MLVVKQYHCELQIGNKVMEYFDDEQFQCVMNLII